MSVNLPKRTTTPLWKHWRILLKSYLIKRKPLHLKVLTNVVEKLSEKGMSRHFERIDASYCCCFFFFFLKLFDKRQPLHFKYYHKFRLASFYSLNKLKCFIVHYRNYLRLPLSGQICRSIDYDVCEVSVEYNRCTWKQNKTNLQQENNFCSFVNRSPFDMTDSGSDGTNCNCTQQIEIPQIFQQFCRPTEQFL